MNNQRTYYVYIMSSFHKTLYIGVTGDLYSRILQHKTQIKEGFTKTYKCFSLVYYEEFQYVNDAIQREKQLKGWRREKKVCLINSINLEWHDLSEDFFLDKSN